MKPILNVEALEAREVPAQFGYAWPNAQSLTLSFAPDGAAIAGYSQDMVSQSQPSALFSDMSPAGTTAAWQTEILRAFQTWAAQTNINIGLIPDAGSPFGPQSTAPGNMPGGDIRVGAFATTPDVLAINQPYNPLSGAWSGSLLFNAAKDFSVGAAQPGKYDVYSVALNEAGNIFGLADRNDPTSGLYGHYLGIRTGLNAADVSAIQTLYGTRAPDTFENNNTLASAYRLNPVAATNDASKKMVSATNADLTSLTDVDYYVFKTGADTTSLTVRLETVGKSLLTAKVSVYDDKNNLVGTATSAGPLAMQDLVLTINGVKAGKDYRVCVEKATNDVFGIGRYDLKVGYNVNPTSSSSSSGASFNSDGGTNNTIATSATLSAVGGSANKQYVYAARIESPTDVDFYKFNSPSSTPVPLTITITPAKAYELYTKVTVYDANKNVVSSDVLKNGDDGQLVLQVANPVASKTYYVKVESVARNGSGGTGNYSLSVDFTQPAVALSTLATGTLTAAQATDYTTFVVPEARMFHFALQATTANPAIVSGVRMIIYNGSYQIVATMTADAGTTTSGAILLGAGTYYVKFEAATKTGEPLPALTYALRAAVLSDPIDPYAPADPLNPPPPPPDYTTQIKPITYYSALPLTDPWTTPWLP